MKKKLSLFLCLMIFASMFLAGCAKTNSVDEAIASDINSKVDAVYRIAGEFAGGDNFGCEFYTDKNGQEKLEVSDEIWTRNQASWEENDGLLFTSKEVFLTGMDSFVASNNECGMIKDVAGNVEIATYDEGYTSNLDVSFDQRIVTMTVLFDEKLNVTSIVFNPVYTIGENLTKAALNTLLGMGTVFCVLILIMCIIMLFKLIPIIEKKLADKKKAKASTEDSVSKTIETIAAKEEDELSDDLELVAVISAAIAAYEGNSSTDGFVVRSIRKSSSKKWQNAQY